ncbi:MULTISPECIES: hypothetical protein [Yersinia pseudotuberculosis complex]|uniref:Putative lipoprotein n=1 Tax=Yersinia pseudotuberculosis TaxID=633 RepID=A0A380QDD5_YERPU|nr:MULTISPECIES: hypothetical protein [Yersinia pseudotuberculosis complex]CNC58330.1 putative lipoprotein [Yersinia pseudotuberculosis]SUP86233.1 putative lipoprotein [Yersinia pseudotuberculosis]
MRWLFALFMTVSCWASLVSGNMLLPPHSTPPGAALSALSAVYSDSHCASYSLSSFHALSGKLRLQNKDVYPQLRLVGVPVKKTANKNRLSAAQFTGSANLSLLNNTWPAAYFAISRSYRADDIYKQPQQSLSLVNYSNWIFHAATQQNRVGGWKESNTQYSGMLTYHDYDAMVFMLS